MHYEAYLTYGALYVVGGVVVGQNIAREYNSLTTVFGTRQDNIAYNSTFKI
mgnify:CR=1 FL=1